MKLLPFVVFILCAALAGYAATVLTGPSYVNYAVSRALAVFMLVFFGLGALVLPILSVLAAADAPKSNGPSHK